MTKVISMNGRGTLTLPKGLRQRLGMADGGGQVIAEETPEGILIRAGATFPVEIYTDQRVVEFARNNDAALAKFRFKKK
jgi:bifunctional DNA-binding transcriptional regulator/antitoxin component of YhaV-PrlF toxin-antitoxin module